jgi:hypothetical protein
MTGAMRAWPVVALVVLTSGCAHPGSSSARDARTRDREREQAAQPTLSTCGTAIDWRADPSLAGEEDAASQIPSPAVTAIYSGRALRVAEAVGIVDELDELHSLPPSVGASGELVEKRQTIIERLELAKADISAAAVTADCEQGRADILRDSLKDRETARTRALTIASLGVGALTSVAAGAWALSDGDASTGPAAVGIAGGALGAVLGALALTTSGSRVHLSHPRNQLRDLWINPARSAIFAPSVWHFLTHGREHEPTVRDQMTSRWMNNGMLGRDDETRAHRIALFFGDGGDYDLDELRARSDMLDELQAEVDLMNQELELLLRQFSRTGARRR